jgi:radical SAM superfamily enzyme YgiQ (UPF0313 family)
MKILFVRPKPSNETIGLQHVMLVEPLELEVLATCVADKNTSTIVDMILEKESIELFIKREQADVFCITGYITNVPKMIQYCEVAKSLNPNMYTVVGGVHCEVCPDDLNHPAIDFRVVRNATTVFPKLIGFIKGQNEFPQGVLKINNKAGKLPEFDFTFPIPDRTLTQRYRSQYFYIFHNKVALLKTAFGCPYSCNFCFCREITKKNYFERPLPEVIEEIKSIAEHDIYIVDDDFLTTRQRVKAFIDANRKEALNKYYLLYGRADFIANNQDLLADFKEVGLRTVIVGFESFFEHELKQYNKNVDVATNEKAMQVLNNIGVECYATIILSPDWGRQEFSLLKKKIKQLGIHFVNLQPMTPLPGTDNKQYHNQLIIPYSDFAKWDLAHVTIQPEKMSVSDFYNQLLGVYNATIFQPAFLLNYLKKHPISMLWKMMKGSYMVWKQYKQKIKEVKHYA